MKKQTRAGRTSCGPWSYAATSQELQEGREAWSRSFPSPCRGSRALLTLGSQTSGLQACETIHFRFLRPSVLVLHCVSFSKIRQHPSRASSDVSFVIFQPSAAEPLLAWPSDLCLLILRTSWKCILLIRIRSPYPSPENHVILIHRSCF